MNRENKYFDPDDFLLNTANKISTAHSSLTFNTKVAKDVKNYDLVKEDSLPVPIFSVKHHEKLNNPLNEFVKEKKDYEAKKRNIAASVGAWYRLKKITRENNITRKNLKNYIVHKCLDPAPYISTRDGFYYYPQHGTLTILSRDNKDYLVHTGDEDELHFDELKPDMPFTKTETFFKRTLHPQEIMISRNTEIAAVRYRREVKIIKIPEFEPNAKENIMNIYDIEYKHKNDILASTLNNRYLATIDSKYFLRRLNADYEFQDINMNLSDYFLDDNLLPVSLSSFEDKHHLISLTTKNTFSLIDWRYKNKIALDRHFTSKDTRTLCDKIFKHAHSLANPNLVHLAMSHTLCTFDYRSLKEPLIHWTHQLYKPIMILATTMYGIEEVICASSNMAGDLKIFNTDGKTANFYPFKPRSIAGTFGQLREEGLFLASDEMKQRVQGTVAGVALFPDTRRKSIKLFAQNYAGDIFENNLYCKPGIKEDDLSVPIERFQLWENFLKRVRNPNKERSAKDRIENGELIVSNIIKFYQLPKYLSDDKSMEINDLAGLEAENNTKEVPKWKISIDEARQCEDILAKEIMLLWDDVDDESESEELQEVESQEKISSKVSRWLSQAEEVEVEIVDEFMPESTSTQAAALTQTTSMYAKKKSRVAGF